VYVVEEEKRTKRLHLRLQLLFFVPLLGGRSSTSDFRVPLEPDDSARRALAPGVLLS
jgi:hypothetical protein